MINVFTKGDALVFDNTIKFGKLLPNDLMFFYSEHPKQASDVILVKTNGDLVEVSKQALRSAHKNEVKAGHRIDTKCGNLFCDEPSEELLCPKCKERVRNG